jgi:NAD(P)H-quinone oxidoreductase subunit 5
MDALVLFALAAALAPAILGQVVPRLSRFGPGPSPRTTAAGAVASLALAFVCAGLYALQGPTSGALLWLDAPGLGRVSFGAHVDGLTILMLLTITLVGTVVAHFARRYMAGDPAQPRFYLWLATTLTAVLMLVIASNLVMFFAAWVATSHGLHRLLTLYRERPAALLAARKKFLISRVGDVLLLMAFVLIYREFGSLEFAEVLPQAAAGGAGPAGVAILLVLGAMTKSAQFPFHTWLPDTMETPTPVSALMHAGIINAGGFLMIRMSPLLTEAPGALALLALGGGFTALFGAVVMLTQTDVKRKYAYSTVSQMGFMMLQCGLGAFAAAALHLVGHAFYKGHAFLSAGSAVDPEVPQPHAPAPRAAGRWEIAVAIALGAAVVAAVVIALGIDPDVKAGFPVLASVLALAVAQMLMTASAEPGASRRTRAAALRDGAAVAVAYFVGVGLLEQLLSGTIPAAGADGGWGIAVTVLVVPMFVLALLLQARLPEAEGGLGARAYVHLQNGLYLGILQNRLVDSLWPVRTPAATPSERS